MALRIPSFDPGVKPRCHGVCPAARLARVTADFTIAAMKNVLRLGVLFLAASLFSGCAQHKHDAPAGLLLDKCVMSGEPLDAKSPTVAYNSGKIGFCCDKCQAKWEKLDDAGKKAAFAKASQK